MADIIKGKIITLRPATPGDRREIYEWLAHSDLTSQMMGPPDFPDSPVPDWEDFRIEYPEYFFDGSRPALGRCFVIEVHSEAVGQINHDMIDDTDHSTWLDIWMKSSAYTNKGYGSDAIDTLCNYLVDTFRCKKIFIAPSARNHAAIRAYEKAGFKRTSLRLPPEMSDYKDDLVMVKIIP